MADWIKATSAPFERARNYFEKRAKEKGERIVLTIIASDAGGIRLANQLQNGTELVESIPWNSIVGVYAFKRDLYAYDRICVLLIADKLSFELDEEDIGWTGFLDGLQKYRPGILPCSEWWEKVTLPAFETKWTVLWEAPKD
jgi:hypothetical protein